MADVLLEFIFFCENPFSSSFSVAWVGAVSNMFDICLFIVFSVLPRVFSFVCELLIDALAKKSKIHKIIIHLEQVFHRQIYIHFSARYKKENRMIHQVIPSALSKPIFALAPQSCIKAL